MFFDVSFDRNKGLVDEIRDVLITVGLSFQPSTRASSVRGREIYQQRFILSFGFRECGIEVFLPIDKHGATFLLRRASFALNELTNI